MLRARLRVLLVLTFSCGGASFVAESRLSAGGFQLLGNEASVVEVKGFLPRGVWDPPGEGIEPVSPTLAGRF